MGLQFTLAKGIGAISTWGLKNVFKRPAGNFPGKIALYVDPTLLAGLRPKMRKGSVLVVGTNGKTTTTNLIADALEADKKQVICNRGGANLDSGVATSLLQADEADWGIFETDELWLAKILPHLKCEYVVLLDLFHDQMDRIAEIDTIQNSIIVALATSPDTVLLYNADDPNCTYIAKRSANRSIGFGVRGTLSAYGSETQSAPMQLCQICGNPLAYDIRQYDQLGDYHCTSCDFARPAREFEAHDAVIEGGHVSFELDGPTGTWPISTNASGAYMVYNLTAVAACSYLLGCSQEAVSQAIGAFNPTNGRLETMQVQGLSVLTNLAKNPAGFAQNIDIVVQGQGPAKVAFFVNDKEGDGRDTSWLWDIDFEALRARSGLSVFAGGIRARDLLLRMKYAGIDASIANSVADVFNAPDPRLQDPKATLLDAALAQNDERAIDVYLIANYTALPPVLAEVRELAKQAPASSPKPAPQANPQEGMLAERARKAAAEREMPGMQESGTADGAQDALMAEPVRIVEVLPDVLNLFGDAKNALILAKRLEWRNIPVDVARITHDCAVDDAVALIESADILCIGTGGVRETRLALADLRPLAPALQAFLAKRGVLLAVDSGFQLLGKTCAIGSETVEGLGFVDMTSTGSDASNRMVGDIAGSSKLAQLPVIGYENHATRTHLAQTLSPFVTLSTRGKHGNNDSDSDDRDGVLLGTLVGTYLHGPVLAKNPEVADALLSSALDHFHERTDSLEPALNPLDDEIERSANSFMAQRLNAK
ncbi:MAG: MurT ligase domain-containing protein [Eggerthellaceae bacterium]|nr:MurT ligase domain-containing protein [Eggerthellaceae bacterium]